MLWSDKVDPAVIDWLLETSSPSARYLAMRDLLDYPPEDRDLRAAHEQAHQNGYIATILAAMKSPGYWVRAGPGYSAKYKSTVWSIIMLAQLGASVHQDQRVALACDHLLEHALIEHGQFTMSGTPSSNIDCLQGNLCAAMIDLGVTDSRLQTTFAWMARSVTGEGIVPATDKNTSIRYYSANCGPGFACGYNDRQPCAWGAIKVLLAFGKLPAEQHTPLMKRAIQMGVDFLFSSDLALADYPRLERASTKPSRNWWKLGFPVFYVADILQNVEALVALGYGGDPRLNRALEMIRAKQDRDGRWPLEHSYNTWVDFGEKNRPNKWVTLRVLRTLKAIDES